MHKRLIFFIMVLLAALPALPAQAQFQTGLTRGAPLQQQGVSRSAAAPRAALPAQTFTVNSLLDRIDIDLTDNVCADMDGQCTLRAAIQSANAAPGSTVNIALAGVFQLAIGGRGEGASMNGDLDIYTDMTIIGRGANQTIINGGKLDGVLHLFTVKNAPTDPNINVSISGIRVANGRNISTNSAQVTSGGITIENATVNLDGVHVVNNSAHIGAGMQIGGTSVVTITNSTINSNIASSFSGGIDIFGGPTVTITNSTISGNTAATGGGLYIEDGGPATIVTLNHTTIAYNTATGAGGGLRSKLTTGGTSGVVFSNSILAYNTATNAPDCLATVEKPFISLGNSIVNDATNCRGFDALNDLQADPLLRPLTLNVPGTTPTHALMLSSPAVDFVGACSIADQRSVMRPFGAACDSGATEQIPTDVPPPGAFTLFSPSNAIRLNLTDDVTDLRWHTAVDGTSYTVSLARTAPTTATIFENVVVDGATCSSGACVYEFTPEQQALIDEGQYQWSVTAHNLGGSTSATAPFTFAIDRRLVRLIRNPSFELMTTSDARFIADFWRKNTTFALSTNDQLLVDRRDMTYRGKNALMFGKVSPHTRRVSQVVGVRAKPEIGEMEPGDRLYLSLTWRGCNLSNASKFSLRINFIDPRNPTKNIGWLREFPIPITCTDADLWRTIARNIKVPARVKTPQGIIEVSQVRNIWVEIAYLNYTVDYKPSARETLYIDNVSLVLDLEPEFTVPLAPGSAPQPGTTNSLIPLPPPAQ